MSSSTPMTASQINTNQIAHTVLVTHWVLKTLGAMALMVSALPASQASEPTYDFSGSFRLRYETLQNPVPVSSSASRPDHNQRISSRIILRGSVNWQQWGAGFEMQDSRAFLDNDDPSLGSSQVNTLEPVQAYISWKGNNTQGLNKVKMGRLTLDLGSRRLVAVGRYRNTQNGFQGLLTQWGVNDWNVQAFYLNPTSRIPNDAQSIDNNDTKLDKALDEIKFYGAFGELSKQWHLYLYVLDEHDSQSRASKDRSIISIGGRHAYQLANNWYGDIEAVWQTGEVSESAKVGAQTIDHQAWFFHASAGKVITRDTKLQAELDIASGDSDSTDGTSRAFDSLFGVRRFDFGPTDTYQGFRRSNIMSPGLRLLTTLTDNSQLMAGYRALWKQTVAHNEDAFFGHQVEFRYRYTIGKRWRLEAGGAYLAKGNALAKGDYPDDTRFAYTMGTLFF